MLKLTFTVYFLMAKRTGWRFFNTLKHVYSIYTAIVMKDE
jgi:hypothetical protein